MDPTLIALPVMLAVCVGWGAVLAFAGIRHTRDLFTEEETP